MAEKKKKKKAVLRRCIGCMLYKEKKDLIRIVKKDNDTLVADETYKAGGRGAYICNDTECLAKAVKRHAFEHNFKMKLSEKDYDTITEIIYKQDLTGKEQKDD